MRVLFLTQIIPYPPDAGPKVKTWHVLRYLAQQGHEVILVSFVRADELQHLPALQRICHAVFTIPIRRSRLKDSLYWARSMISRRPFLVERDDRAALHKLVRHIFQTQSIDCIHADQLTMTQFAIQEGSAPLVAAPAAVANKRPFLVFDAHNAVWTIVDRMAKSAPPYLRPALKLEAKRVRRYEGQMVRGFDRILAVTEIDRGYLLQAAREGATMNGELASKIEVIPIAVDTQQSQPVRRAPGSLKIITLGTLHYPPNADGIRWFIQSVFPKIRESVPEASLTIVGKNPPADFLRLASLSPETITVTGYVPDLAPYLEQAAVMVVPVRAGSGMRVRILEAFARAMPVVTTTIGLEGIEACPGSDVLVADTPDAFAQAVIRLLADTDLQDRLAENGRRLAERQYDWQVVLQKLDLVFDFRSPAQ
jgi:glycosyltransferase involved in cell wall biosynthesis